MAKFVLTKWRKSVVLRSQTITVLPPDSGSDRIVFQSARRLVPLQEVATAKPTEWNLKQDFAVYFRPTNSLNFSNLEAKAVNFLYEEWELLCGWGQ
eukprot:1829-Rhodomonas_salina.2